jgi:hypothetical protein
MAVDTLCIQTTGLIQHFFYANKKRVVSKSVLQFRTQLDIISDIQRKVIATTLIVPTPNLAISAPNGGPRSECLLGSTMSEGEYHCSVLGECFIFK